MNENSHLGCEAKPEWEREFFDGRVEKETLEKGHGGVVDTSGTATGLTNGEDCRGGGPHGHLSYRVS